MTSGFASPAIIAAIHPPCSQDCLYAAASLNGPKAIYSSSCSSIVVPISLSTSYGRSKCAFSISRKNLRSTISRDVSVKSTASVDADADADLSSTTSLEAEEDEKAKAKVGARVRVTVPLKVYHVVRVPEVELMGMEGFIKDYVVVWKGKRISANLPYKVQFVKEIEGRGPVKFFAHLKEDEFEFLDP